jgi:hypothetical protein
VTYKRLQRDEHGAPHLESIALSVDQDKEIKQFAVPYPPPGCTWVVVVVLCTLVSNICSIDRTAMSVAVLPMAQEYKWADTVKGAVNGYDQLGCCPA